MRRITRLPATVIGSAVLALALLAGCAGPPTQQDAGMIIGGGLGALLGAQVGGGQGQLVATVLGTMVGAAIGGSVGRSMDDLDRMRANNALESVRTGVPSTWRNPDNGNQYAVTPTRTYDNPAGPCREYVMDAVIGGRKERVYGTACRQADGSWRTQS